MENIINFISNIDNSTYNKIRHSKSDAECRRYLKEQLTKQLTLTDVGGSFSQNDMENFAAKCMILGSGGKDTKELLKDFCDNDR